MSAKKTPIQSAVETDGIVKEGYSVYGRIYSEDPKDPNNPEVLIIGMGRLTFDTLKSSIVNLLQDVITNVKDDKFGAALSLLDGMFYHLEKQPGIISHKIRALKDVQAELESKKKRKK